MVKIKSEKMAEHFQLLQWQREQFYQVEVLPFDEVWRRPRPEKWSVGETLYHLILMCRFFRRVSIFYIPVMTPIARWKNKPYPFETYDIYKAYHQVKMRGMKAPKLITPPEDIAEKYTLYELKEMLNNETNQLMKLVSKVPERTAGNIYYFDPVAHHPNLIQSIHLLAIHEQHHFDLMIGYFGELK